MDQVLKIKCTCMNLVSSIGDYDILILIDLFLVLFKLNDVKYSDWLMIGFMVKLHASNLIQSHNVYSFPTK